MAELRGKLCERGRGSTVYVGASAAGSGRPGAGRSGHRRGRAAAVATEAEDFGPGKSGTAIRGGRAHAQSAGRRRTVGLVSPHVRAWLWVQAPRAPFVVVVVAAWGLAQTQHPLDVGTYLAAGALATVSLLMVLLRPADHSPIARAAGDVPSSR